MDDGPWGGYETRNPGDSSRRRRLKLTQVRPALSNAIDVVRNRIQQNRDRKEILGE
jgi:hypothetical protein